MATAEMSEEVVMVPKKEKIITLKLNESEARTLMAISGRVGGSPTLSPRGWMNNIADALESAGLPVYKDVKEYGSIDGHISFSNYSDKRNAPNDRLQVL